MRLGTCYGAKQLEAACGWALLFEMFSYRGVKNILESGADRLTPEGAGKPEKPHVNLRGPRYYS